MRHLLSLGLGLEPEVVGMDLSMQLAVRCARCFGTQYRPTKRGNAPLLLPAQLAPRTGHAAGGGTLAAICTTMRIKLERAFIARIPVAI